MLPMTTDCTRDRGAPTDRGGNANKEIAGQLSIAEDTVKATSQTYSPSLALTTALMRHDRIKARNYRTLAHFSTPGRAKDHSHGYDLIFSRCR